MKVIFAYTITLFGNSLPERSMPMDSLEAAQMAMQGLLTGVFTKAIEENGGSVVATITVTK